jgi:hypothetical protein
VRFPFPAMTTSLDRSKLQTKCLRSTTCKC